MLPRRCCLRKHVFCTRVIKRQTLTGLPFIFGNPACSMFSGANLASDLTSDRHRTSPNACTSTMRHSKATKAGIPWTLAHHEGFPTRSATMAREAHYETGRGWLELQCRRAPKMQIGFLGATRLDVVRITLASSVGRQVFCQNARLRKGTIIVPLCKSHWSRFAHSTCTFSVETILSAKNAPANKHSAEFRVDAPWTERISSSSCG